MQAEPSPSLPCAGAPGAPKPGVAAPRRIEVGDPRADGRRRVVVLAPDCVKIARSVAGVFMHIAVPPKAYRGVALRLKALSEAGFHYEIELSHRDPDLCVKLHEAVDDSEIRAEWRLWAKFLGVPALVEREDRGAEPAEPRLGEIVIGRVRARRRGRAMRARRPRFLVRRKTGARGPMCRLPAERREIFPGWK